MEVDDVDVVLVVVVNVISFPRFLLFADLSSTSLSLSSLLLLFDFVATLEDLILREEYYLIE